MEVIFEFGEQIERLKTVNTESLEEIIVGSKLLARHFKMGGRKAEDFVQGLLGRRHRAHCNCGKSTVIARTAAGLSVYGKYGCAAVLSTNFLSPAFTAGRVNSSQNK